MDQANFTAQKLGRHFSL